MKTISICVFLVLVLATSTSAQEPYSSRANYLSFTVGGYAPSGELDDEGYKSGGDFGFSYMSPIGSYFGFGGDVHKYESESSRTSADIGDGDFESVGVEGLFYLQLNNRRIQPYVALGPAIYFNEIEYTPNVGNEEIDETGTGFGVVVKLGLRVFVIGRFFGGVLLKGFSNQWNLEIEDSIDETYQFGGGIVAFEAGFIF